MLCVLCNYSNSISNSNVYFTFLSWNELLAVRNTKSSGCEYVWIYDYVKYCKYLTTVTSHKAAVSSTFECTGRRA